MSSNMSLTLLTLLARVGHVNELLDGKSGNESYRAHPAS